VAELKSEATTRYTKPEEIKTSGKNSATKSHGPSARENASDVKLSRVRRLEKPSLAGARIDKSAAKEYYIVLRRSTLERE